MSKELKLSLEDLEVESFVTILSDDEKNELKGGGWPTWPECPYDPDI